MKVTPTGNFLVRRIELLVLFLILVHMQVLAQASLSCPIRGLQRVGGQLLYSLYRSPDGFPDLPQKAFRMGSLPVSEISFTLDIGALPPGEYALCVIHDSNGNGRLDKNGLGIPTEPIGFSNNVMGAFGPPKFSRARFNIVSGKNELAPIRMRMGQ